MGWFKGLAVIVLLVAIGWQVLIRVYLKEPVGPASRFTVDFGNNDVVTMERTKDGVQQIWAKDWKQYFRGLGYAHTKDRAVQMMLIRAISQGRLSEKFASDETTLKIDTFMRKLGFYHTAQETMRTQANAEWVEIVREYSAGVNKYLEDNKDKLPFELLLTGYEVEPWTPVDSLCMGRLISYVGLSDTQQNAEKIIIQSFQDSTEAGELMKALNAPHLDGIDDTLLELIKKIRVEEEIIPASDIPIPQLRASNNWAVSGAKSVSGNPIYSSDPHLNVLQLPPVWYETAAHVASTENYAFGISFPGVPAFLMGRTKHVAYGLTYGFMDLVDYFIEHCKGDTCKRGDQFVPIQKRVEAIKRKGDTPVEVAIYSTVHGVLEVKDASKPLTEGYYLSRSLVSDAAGPGALIALYNILEAKTVPEAQMALAPCDFSMNMILVDRKGNIGYQQTGALPDRVGSGLFPLPGWDPKNDWKGTVPADQLTSILNPESGILATANNYISTPGKPLAINLDMGDYRKDRIEELLQAKEKISKEDCRRIQTDLFSNQAKKFMEYLRPLLPSTAVAQRLATWDLRYDLNSTGAPLFEDFYFALLEDVFGKVYKNPKAWERALRKGFGPFFRLFDDLIFEYSPNHDKLLWKGESRDQLFTRIISKVLQGKTEANLLRYQDTRSGLMPHMLFGGKLGIVGKILGADFGPISLPGSRASICQGQQWTDDGRVMSFAPSWRFVTDIATDEVDSILPGGPSGNIFSGLYTSETESWMHGQLKTTKL